eukprot:TRINITY_DN8614_c0_g1_i1.p1 TRINITY_DN8614_c0_g1~~TRINITY_DN8614_c0_g1_i1.p1  ORF type:complete len:111 (+),score=7.48 TRINITY_DN8614_c0_g1_i1:41-334(+)
MGAALPICNYRWHCAFGWYRAIISHIDGPFKVITFCTAVWAATQRRPGAILKVPPMSWVFRSQRPGQRALTSIGDSQISSGVPPLSNSETNGDKKDL